MTAIDRMIDLQHGTVSREIFVSPQFYRDELEKLFARAWLFIGHESQIPRPGDFFVSRMGEESVILCRDEIGSPVDVEVQEIVAANQQEVAGRRISHTFDRIRHCNGISRPQKMKRLIQCKEYRSAIA